MMNMIEKKRQGSHDRGSNKCLVNKSLLSIIFYVVLSSYLCFIVDNDIFMGERYHSIGMIAIADAAMITNVNIQPDSVDDIPHIKSKQLVEQPEQQQQQQKKQKAQQYLKRRILYGERSTMGNKKKKGSQTLKSKRNSYYVYNDMDDDLIHQLMQNISENKTCTVSSTTTASRKNDMKSNDGCSIILKPVSVSSSLSKHALNKNIKQIGAVQYQEQNEERDVILTAIEKNPYLVIDLKGVNYIDSIHIHRASTAGMDFSISTTNVSSRAYARNDTEATASSTYSTHIRFDSQDIVLSVHAPARFVRLQALALCSLSLSYIQVTGLPPDEEWPYLHHLNSHPSRNPVHNSDFKTMSDREVEQYSRIEKELSKGCVDDEKYPLICNNRGTCKNKKCHCDWLYTGKFCESLNHESVVFVRISGFITTVTIGFIVLSFFQNRLNLQGFIIHLMSFPPLFIGRNVAASVRERGCNYHLVASDCSDPNKSNSSRFCKMNGPQWNSNNSKNDDKKTNPECMDFEKSSCLKGNIRERKVTPPKYPFTTTLSSTNTPSPEQELTPLQQKQKIREYNDSDSFDSDEDGHIDECFGLHLLFASPLVISSSLINKTSHFYTDVSNTLVPLEPLDIVEECELLQQSLKLAAEKPLACHIPFTVSCGTANSLSSMLTLDNTKVLHISANCDPKYIAFEDVAGGAHVIKTNDLGRILKANLSDSRVKLVVINSSNSFNIAKEFCSVGIPHVITVQANKHVRESNTNIFTKSFYLALACGRSVEQSFEIAKVSIRTAPSDDPTSPLEADSFALLPEDGDHSTIIWPLYASRDNAKKAKMLSKKISLSKEPPVLKKTRIPSISETFIGRNRQMYEILRYLHIEKRRILLIVGESGIGKSEIAVAIAQHLSFRACQVYWTQVSNERSNTLDIVHDLINQYESMLDISPKSSPRERLEKRNELNFTPVASQYLVVDGCDEMIIKSSPFLNWCSQLIMTTNMRIIITARTTIDENALLRGHVTYHLHPLADDDAVKLFCKLVHRPLLVVNNQPKRRSDSIRSLTAFTTGVLNSMSSSSSSSSSINSGFSNSLQDIKASSFMKELGGHPGKIKYVASQINSIRCTSQNEPYILPQHLNSTADILGGNHSIMNQ